MFVGMSVIRYLSQVRRTREASTMSQATILNAASPNKCEAQLAGGESITIIVEPW